MKSITPTSNVDPIRARDGFTLIELLVVISIIVILISILVPALEKAIAKTRLTICASNLHQVAVGVTQYATEFKGMKMTTRNSPWNGNGVNPEYIGTNPDEYNGQWNIHRINPYVWVADVPTREIAGVFTCPDTSEEFYRELSKAHWDRWAEDGRWFTQTSYTYFAGVETWTHAAMNGAEDDISSRLAGGSKLMVSDVLMPNSDGQLFRYNHGKRGWAWSYAPGNTHGATLDNGNPELLITGVNQAFGDGSAHWKPANEFPVDNMRSSATYPYGWVKRANNAPMYY